MEYIVVFPDGMRVILPTLEDVVALRRRAAGLAESAPEPEPKNNQQVAPTSQGSWETLCRLMVEPKYVFQHRILGAVKGHAKGITADDLMRALSISEPGGFGARIAGVGRLAKAAGFRTDELLVATGGAGNRGYVPGHVLAANSLPPVPETTGGRR